MAENCSKRLEALHVTEKISPALVLITWIIVQISWVKRWKITIRFYHLSVFVLPDKICL